MTQNSFKFMSEGLLLPPLVLGENGSRGVKLCYQESQVAVSFVGRRILLDSYKVENCPSLLFRMSLNVQSHT